MPKNTFLTKIALFFSTQNPALEEYCGQFRDQERFQDKFLTKPMHREMKLMKMKWL